MGKKKQGRQLKRGAEVENAGMGSKERKREGLREEESMKSQRRGMKANEDEERIDRAIEEMLTECHQRALEDYVEPIDYDLGGDLEVRKRMPTSPGQGGEKKSISQAVERSKQSAGMDRGQRRSSGEELLKRSTGEVWRSSHFACGHPSRLDLEPCRGGAPLTEQSGSTSWRMILRHACGEKESSWKDMGPALSQTLEVLANTTRCGQSTEGIFPLPLPGALGWCDEEDSVLEALVRGLNSLYGVGSAWGRKVTKVQRRVLERLRTVVNTMQWTISGRAPSYLLPRVL